MFNNAIGIFTIELAEIFPFPVFEYPINVHRLGIKRIVVIADACVIMNSIPVFPALDTKRGFAFPQTAWQVDADRSTAIAVNAAMRSVEAISSSSSAFRNR